MNISPEIVADLFRQCAFISALIAGFSFAFLAVILTSPTKQKVDDWTAGFAIAATAGLIVCALGWTFSVQHVLSLSGSTLSTNPFQLTEPYRMIHRSLSLTFIVCFFLFFISLGLSGWIRSKILGIVSTIIATLASIYAFWLLRFFIK